MEISRCMHLRSSGFERSEGIRNWLEHFVIHFHFFRGLARVECGVCHDQREEITDVAGGFAGSHKNGQVGNVEACTALSGNVSGGEKFYNPPHRPCCGSINRPPLWAWGGAEAPGGLQHPWDGPVVYKKAFNPGLGN